MQCETFLRMVDFFLRQCLAFPLAPTILPCHISTALLIKAVCGSPYLMVGCGIEIMVFSVYVWCFYLVLLVRILL